jgi:thioredoxin reductase
MSRPTGWRAPTVDLDTRQESLVREMEPSNTRLDVVVIGGGAAGLTAALVLGRARRSVAIVDAGEPRNAPAAHMQGFLSRDGMPPAELLAAGRSEIAGYGVGFVSDRVDSIEPGFVVRLAGGDALVARRVLLATGCRDELADIPGVRERWGRDLLHCPYCHGWEVRDQPLGVLGTNAGSVQHALLIRQWSDDVVFFAHTVELGPLDLARLDARGVQVEYGEVARLVIEEDRLTGVELPDGRRIPRAAVFIRPINVPHPDGLLAGLGCEVDDAGFPVVDHTGKTSVAGVWVAGNAADPRAQVITSAGAGSAAAIAINADLVGEDVRRAMEEIGLGGDHPADPDRGKEPHWDGAASESQDDTRSGGWPALTQPSHRRTR